jgi:hypothetical protein
MAETIQISRQKDMDEFHMMIGYCVAAWAEVDEQLFEIFASAIGPRDQSAILYYRTPGLDVRLKTTDEIVLSVLPERKRASGGHDHPDVVEWKKARKGFEDLLSERRRIAHHQVGVSVYFDDSGDHFKTAFEIFMSYQERLRGKGSPDDTLGIDDLRSHLAKVKALRSRLLNFCKHFLKKPPPSN